MADWSRDVLLEKFNPNHDDLGRFTTGSTSWGPRKFTGEALSPAKNIGYHTTRKEVLKDILKHGLKPQGGALTESEIRGLDASFLATTMSHDRPKGFIQAPLERFLARRVNKGYAFYTRSLEQALLASYPGSVVLKVKLPPEELSNIKRDFVNLLIGHGNQAYKYKGTIQPEWIVGYFTTKKNMSQPVNGGRPFWTGYTDPKKFVEVNKAADEDVIYTVVFPEGPFQEDYEDLEKKDTALRTLYACRYVENAEEIIKWAKEQGFKTTLQPGDMHVTIAYSKKPVDWDEAKASDDDTGKLTVSSGGTRKVKPLGDGGAVVLTFYNETLQDRHMEIREAGASWDHARYNPHVTISWDAADVDLDKVKPYTGEIVLGPEVFKEIDEDWSDKVSEKHQTFSVSSKILSTNIPIPDELEPTDYTVAKVDKRHGLVFGWSIVCKHKNCSEDYYDLNVDRHTGKRVPEHIPEDTMLEAATDFMEHSRVVKEMHKGEGQGTVVFAFPLTTDIAKAMGIQTQVTGLMVAIKPTPELLKKFESGELKGFSIGGSKVAVEDFHED